MLQARREKRGKAPLPRAVQVAAKRRKELLEKLAAQKKKAKKLEEQIFRLAMLSQQPRSLTIGREPPPPGVDEDVDDEEEAEDPYFCETAIFSPGKPADDDNNEDDEEGDMFYKDEEESVWPDLEDLDGRNNMVSGDDESADDGSDASLESANDAADEDLMFILEYAQKRRDKRSKKAWKRPFPDNDPEPEKQGSEYYPPDDKGWTRNNRPVHTQSFAGPRPTSPTQDRETTVTVLDYFLSFFPLALSAKIAKWTNVVLRASKAKPKPRETTTAKNPGMVRHPFCDRVHSYFQLQNYWSPKPEPCRGNVMKS